MLIGPQRSVPGSEVPKKLKKPRVTLKKQDFDEKALPSRIDCREWGGVTPVQDQGDFNSCWAFATTAANEGVNYAAHGKLVKYPE
jgi:C1A family cysteine protease